MSKKSGLLPKRVYQDLISEDLKNKMVFLGGPRQVGKTTLAQTILSKKTKSPEAYLNWDNENDRRTINKMEWSKDLPLIVLDEIHKKKGWQSFVKGAWDKWKDHQNIIVTGSARLDIFRKGGESLLGRYHYYRIHPFTLPELGMSETHLQALFQYGGFPEPLLQQNPKELRRWHQQRVSKLVRQDLRDLENVSDLDKVELLADLLQTKVGSPYSYKSIAEDLDVSDKTIKRWTQILDNLYYCYLLPPFGSPKIKAVKKTQKLYLWDWSQVENLGYRFENMVGSHLLKYCDFLQDTEGYRMELRYIRDETGKECDFVVLKDRKPIFAVECKVNETDLSPSLLYFKSKLAIPMWYQVNLDQKSRWISPDLAVLPFDQFCEHLKLV